ncbi:ribosomal protein L13 [Nadsonia fulvescens var. elongata DSM 6958]|uniref:Ribosomal protein L13 n=1 Tax=Nadsonia fulvescens var. elongata DSM 6958 TaxID=857566 RepID=A0A1E3PP88_9ASCO|nr:ribosomal protein L13 [Nadsonia fulvescens var. elongata DSM 6958]
MSQNIGRTALAHARSWHHVDAAKDGRSLGRLASAIAMTLMGKHKPIFHPSVDVGDFVVVSNCHHIKVTGNKMTQKLYRRHSTMPGQLKEVTMERLFETKGGGEALRNAVSKMLPKNKMRQLRLSRLKTSENDEHVYKDNIVAYHDESPLVQKIKAKMESQQSK